MRKKLAKREKNGKSHTKVDLRRWMTFYITKTLQLNVMRVDLASSPFFIKKIFSKKNLMFENHRIIFQTVYKSENILPLIKE